MTKFSLESVRIERREIPDNILTFELPAMPPSVNTMYRNVPNVGRVKTQAFRDWSKSAGLILNAQIKGRMSGRVDIRIKLEDTHPTADCSNYIKATEDLLVQAGVISDDRSKYVRSVKAEWAPIKGVKIEIERVAA